MKALFRDNKVRVLFFVATLVMFVLASGAPQGYGG